MLNEIESDVSHLGLIKKTTNNEILQNLISEPEQENSIANANLKVSDVLNESGSVKKEVWVKMKKTKKTTLNLPLSKNSISVIKKYLLERKREDFIFRSTHYHYTRKPLSIYQYSRIVKNWLRGLVVVDVSEYSTHYI